MSTRREFVIAAAASAVAGLPAASALACGHAASTATGLPRRAAFEALAGQTFGIGTAAGGHASLSLGTVRAQAPDPEREQFSLVFRAPADVVLEAGRHQLDHSSTGRFVLWLEPSGERDGARVYRADLSLRA